MAVTYFPSFEKLIEAFQHLPGIGRKTAVRLALFILEDDESSVEAFSEALLNAKRSIKRCRKCFNYCENELCPVCSDASRDKSIICVVEDSKAILSFDRVKEYRGVYHVLGGVISPMDGVGPEDLNIAELISRIKEDSVKEVIIATNPTVNGETTAMYITRLLKPMGIKISRLAYGIPVGGELEYADEMTLSRAIEGRREI